MNLFYGYLAHLTYLGIFLLLGVSGLFVPIPEEVVLLIIGYGAAAGAVKLAPAMIVGFLSMLIGDFAVYSLSKRKSAAIAKLGERVRVRDVGKYKAMILRHPGRSVFLLRFAIGLRFLSLIMAGTLEIPARIFLAADGLALIIYTPLLVLLGYYFHDKFTLIITETMFARHLISFAFFALVFVLILFMTGKRRRKSR